MPESLNDANHALGRLPSGISILTAVDASGTRSTGMLASWIQQAGFAPPTLTVAIGIDRYVRGWIQETGRFTINIIGAGNKGLVKHFGRGFEPDANAFEGVALRDDLGSDCPPVLADALAYLVVEPRNEMLSGDHAIVLCEIIGGGLIAEGEPMVHVRKVGSHY